MAAPKHFSQIDAATMEESSTGTLFMNPSDASVFDLSGIRVLHFGTDTVRQLYRGTIKSAVLSLFDVKGELVEFAGHQWHPGRIGRDSGYQFRLQNADLGIILLIKSFHVDAITEGPHLKIEVSPHAILGRTSAELQSLLDYLADHVLLNSSKVQCAVHIAMDVQGWQPGNEFEQHLHCRSRRTRSFSGIDSLDVYSGSARYGRGETYMFGAPSGIQLCVYNKTAEARARDKLDFWSAVWALSGHHDPAQDVYRVEFRFHHSVVQQFSDGTCDEDTGELCLSNDYVGLFPFLAGLWRYGLDNFRYLVSPKYFHPAWTLFRGYSISDDEPKVRYRRHHKTASGFSGKNVELLLGNFVSLAARNRMSASLAWKALQALPFFEVITEHYNSKGKEVWQVRQHLSRLLDERYVRYGMAV